MTDDPASPRFRWLRPALLTLAFVLVPILFTAPFAERITSGLQALATADPMSAFLAVTALFAIDVIISMPNLVVGAFAGALVGWEVATLAIWCGTMLASLLGYAIGRYAARPLARRFMSAPELAMAEARAERMGWLIMFVSRPVPVLGEMMLIAGGLARMSVWKFVTATGAANAILAPLYALAGEWLADDGQLWLILPAAIVATVLLAVAGKRSKFLKGER
ncbi:MAG: VTT domain-containing protein [Pacificimonas sp.]